MRASSASSRCSASTSADCFHGGHRGGFNHHVAHERELERQLALVLGHAGTEIHKPGQRGAAERQEMRLVDDPGDTDEPRPDVGGGTLHRLGHVRLDLEQLGEAVVIGQQGFVQLLVADEHDLEVQGDRLRLDALGADRAVRHVARLLKARGTGAQGAEKPFPCAGCWRMSSRCRTRGKPPLARCRIRP